MDLILQIPTLFTSLWRRKNGMLVSNSWLQNQTHTYVIYIILGGQDEDIKYKLKKKNQESQSGLGIIKWGLFVLRDDMTQGISTKKIISPLSPRKLSLTTIFFPSVANFELYFSLFSAIWFLLTHMAGCVFIWDVQWYLRWGIS